MVPAGDEFAAGIAADLIRFGVLFNVTVKDPEGIRALYVKHLGGIPRIALLRIRDRCERTWSWGNRLPFPGELVEMVKGDMERLIKVKGRAELARGKIAKTLEGRRRGVLGQALTDAYIAHLASSKSEGQFDRKGFVARWMDLNPVDNFIDAVKRWERISQAQWDHLKAIVRGVFRNPDKPVEKPPPVEQFDHAYEP